MDRLQANGNTIVLVTHEHDIAEFAHRVIYVRDGVVEKDEKKAGRYVSRQSSVFSNARPSSLQSSAERCAGPHLILCHPERRRIASTANISFRVEGTCFSARHRRRAITRTR